MFNSTQMMQMSDYEKQILDYINVFIYVAAAVAVCCCIAAARNFFDSITCVCTGIYNLVTCRCCFRRQMYGQLQ